MALALAAKNRIAFGTLGLANSFVFVILLSAAYDLLSRIGQVEQQVDSAANRTRDDDHERPTTAHCLTRSTSVMLLATATPSLLIKLVYPLALTAASRRQTNLKVAAVVALMVVCLLAVGRATSELRLLLGVVCGSLATGLGESTLVSLCPKFGRAALGGWSVGSGCAGISASLVYAVLKMYLSVAAAMAFALVAPAAIAFAYFRVVDKSDAATAVGSEMTTTTTTVQVAPEQPASESIDDARKRQQQTGMIASLRAKSEVSPRLAKYVCPLALVYFAEYFINQGLLQFVHFADATPALDRAAQFRWLQVAYAVGTLISRSSLELVRLRYLWTMTTLQWVNLCVIFAHVLDWLQLPSFQLTFALVIYEGLLGGFVYINAFDMAREEFEPQVSEFCISVLVAADSVGVVAAGLLATPTHKWICSL